MALRDRRRGRRPELRKVLSASCARVLDAELAVATAHEAFDGDALIDDELSAALGVVVQELLNLAGQRPDLAPAAV